MIRRYRPGDHLAIGRIYYEAVHRLAARDYDEAQLRAWAPAPDDREAWARHWEQRCARKRPFVKESGGIVVGFMELDPDGHIDCTYVDPAHARTGVMTQILAAVVEEARRCGVRRLHAEVSRTARPFFASHGFTVISENLVAIRGERLTNFLMERHLAFPEDPPA